jgi:1-pyrroline-4-hydroxy-2-carboxylate deaminase
LIKYVQEVVGMGDQRVRPPRMVLTGDELEQTKRIIQQALSSRPR